LSDDIIIRIKTLLEKATDAELKKVEQDIQNRVNPKIKIDIDSQNLNKASEKYVDMQNSVSGVTQRTKEWVTSTGEIVKQTEMLKAGTTEISKRITDTTIDYKKQRDELERITSQIHKQSLAQQDLLNKIRGMRGIDGKFIVGDNLNALNQLESQITGFNPTNKNFKKNMDDANSKLKQITTSTSIYKKEVQDANKYTGLFGQSIFEAGKKFASWLLIGNVIIGAMRIVRNGIQFVADLDNAMNQLRIVMNLSNEDAVQLGKSYNALAKEMSVTTTEIAKAAVEYARQGLSLEQMDDRLRNTIKYAKISGMEFQEAAEIITASVNSMGIETERAVDIFSYMGDATATGADEIGRALQRVGKNYAA